MIDIFLWQIISQLILNNNTKQQTSEKRMLKFFQRFLNLFHRKQRFNPNYQNLAFLKKLMFFGSTGFILTLSFSKLIYNDLIFSFQPTQANKLYVKLNPALQRGVYHPSMFMLLGVFQRLYARFREEEPYLRTQEQEIQGETVSWVVLHDKSYQLSLKQRKKLPVIVVICGSQGIDNTLKSVLLASYNIGFRVVTINPTDLFDTDRLGKMLIQIKKAHPQSELMGVGVQYGANLLLNYAAKETETFKCLISIGNPFDLTKSEINLQQKWLWRQLYSSMLKGKIQKAISLNNKNPQIHNSTLFELQRQLYNIKDEDYLTWKEQNSSINHIKNIKVPTMLLQSQQDPFTQKIQDERFQNEKCIYVTTQRGGHNEWFENLWMHRWLMSPIRGFLKLVHSNRVEEIVAKENVGLAIQG